jgi:hypothetical protein
MKKAIIGILFGVIAGVIDVIPMVIQNLTWDANISAFSMWVVIGFFVAVHDFKVPTVLGSIITAFLVLLPAAVLIGWKDSVSLIPIAGMTLVLGALLGLFIGIVKKRMRQV